MPFPLPLDLRVIPGGKYKILAGFPYTHPDFEDIEVPEGEETDLASIPRLARWLVTGHDQTRKPAVIHDYLYKYTIGTRKEADLIFLEGMKETGTPVWKRTICYRAVRLGGSASWHKYREVNKTAF